MYIFRRIRSSFAVTTGLAGIAIAALGFYILVAGAEGRGQNRLTPFLYLLILCFGIIVVVVLRYTFRSASPEARERILRELEEKSYLHPDNLPKDRYKDGSIG